MVSEGKTEETEKALLMAPDIALKLLDDPQPSVRAEAASALAISPDMRAVRKLINCLEDLDDGVRTAGIDALIAYPRDILPSLETSLLEASPRGKQGILEVIRLSSNISDFEMAHLLGRSVEEAYGNLIVVRRLQAIEQHPSVQMLSQHLLARNEEILGLLFYGLWVYHADMRLMYQALQSENASVAIEMVETSIRGQNLPYLIPLIDDLPLDEKIQKGRKLFNLVSRDDVELLLTELAYSEDRFTRMLSVYVMADLPSNPAFIPVIESRLEDVDLFVRQVSEYAANKIIGKEAQVPEIIDVMNKLKMFSLFQGLGNRELHAIASVAEPQHLHAGDIIIRAGEENPSIYLILSGKIGVYHNFDTPQQAETRISEADGYLNFVPMFANLPPANTSVVIEDAEVLVLPQSQLHEIMRVYPQIGLNMLKLAAMIFRQLGYTA
jgi:hypothetical protein